MGSVLPKISVITVVRNRADTIEDTILSVATQRYPHVEHIIIDGASTDGTLEIITRYRAKIAGLITERDRGIYDAMNKGIVRATGDIIGFLNADDVYADNRVLEQVAAIFEKSDVDGCYADLVYVDRNNSGRVIRYWKSCPYADGLFARGWMPPHPTFFVRRDVYREQGRFDLSYRKQADFELAMRLFLKGGIRTVYIPQVLVRMRSGGASSGFMHILQGNVEAYRACQKYGLRVTPLFVVRKILSRLPQFIHRPQKVPGSS